MPLTYKETKRILLDLGFVYDRQSGSHEQRKLNDKLATIAHHKEYPIKTAKSMLNQISFATNIPVKDLIQRYNIKL
jgi:predicted RNA binding protein YcfA (HicA-like mRNA interferase family)